MPFSSLLQNHFAIKRRTHNYLHLLERWMSWTLWKSRAYWTLSLKKEGTVSNTKHPKQIIKVEKQRSVGFRLTNQPTNIINPVEVQLKINKVRKEIQSATEPINSTKTMWNNSTKILLPPSFDDGWTPEKNGPGWKSYADLRYTRSSRCRLFKPGMEFEGDSQLLGKYERLLGR